MMKAFIIHLPDRPHSVEHSDIMLKQLLDYDIDAELFEGINGEQAQRMIDKSKRRLYPYSIKNKSVSAFDLQKYLKPDLAEEFFDSHYYRIYQRQRIGEDTDKFNFPGVKGCFMSHYLLWQKCIELGEPIMIFEDDVVFYRGWTPVQWEGVLILSLGKSSFLNEPFKTYLEDPQGNPQPMPWPLFSMPGASGYAIMPDTALGLYKFYKSYYYPADNAINQSVCRIQIHNYVMGRNSLAEEGNVSMTRFRVKEKKNHD